MAAVMSFTAHEHTCLYAEGNRIIATRTLPEAIASMCEMLGVGGPPTLGGIVHTAMCDFRVHEIEDLADIEHLLPERATLLSYSPLATVPITGVVLLEPQGRVWHRQGYGPDGKTAEQAVTNGEGDAGGRRGKSFSSGACIYTPIVYNTLESNAGRRERKLYTDRDYSDRYLAMLAGMAWAARREIINGSSA